MYGYAPEQKRCTLLAQNMNESQSKTKSKIATKFANWLNIKRRFLYMKAIGIVSKSGLTPE